MFGCFSPRRKSTLSGSRMLVSRTFSLRGLAPSGTVVFAGTDLSWDALSPVSNLPPVTLLSRFVLLFLSRYLKLCSSFFDHPSSWNAAAWSEGRGRREACKQSFLFLGTLPFGYPSGCLVCVNPNLHVDQGSDRSQRPTHLINNLWFVIHSYVRHFFFLSSWLCWALFKIYRSLYSTMLISILCYLFNIVSLPHLIDVPVSVNMKVEDANSD